MPPEARLLGLGVCLPGDAVPNQALAGPLGLSAEEIGRRTGIGLRHHAGVGEGPSDLALRAAESALRAAVTRVEDIGLIVFATATPDVCFPGAACYLQNKLAAGTVGALDIRAQSAGFLCGLDLMVAFAALEAPSGGPDRRYERMLLAAGEVLSTGLDESPRGADLTPRFGDGAAVAIVGRSETGARIRAVHWTTEGELADRFWCEFPASRRFPLRVVAEDLAAGRQFPRADLAGLAPIVRERLRSISTAVLEECGWGPGDLDAFVVDYVEPPVAAAVASDLGVPVARTTIPTAKFGHVMAAGLPIALGQMMPGLSSGSRVLLAAAGPGVTFGAAALEF